MACNITGRWPIRWIFQRPYIDSVVNQLTKIESTKSPLEFNEFVVNKRGAPHNSRRLLANAGKRQVFFFVQLENL